MNNFFKCRLWTVTLLLLGKRYQARKTSDFLPSYYYGIDNPQSLLLALDNEVTPCVRKCKEGGREGGRVLCDSAPVENSFLQDLPT